MSLDTCSDAVRYYQLGYLKVVHHSPLFALS